MDILPCPEFPSRPIERAHYLCNSLDRWDGGPFLAYLDRRNLRHTIPVPFSNLFQPARSDEQELVYTTWLFFGLIAEFLGVNGQENPPRPPDNPDTERTLNDIYRHCITEDNGNLYLSGASIPSLLTEMVASINRSLNIHARLQYLSECLLLSGKMLAWTDKAFDNTLKFAIAALGELLTSTINAGLENGEFGAVSVPSPVVHWKLDYLAEESPFRQQMMHAGWCKSDLNRIETVYNTLSSAHYLSLLDRDIPGRQHSQCTETKCHAAQINNEIYRLSHAVEGCQCREFIVDTAKIKDILMESDTYPVLAFGSGDGPMLTVKPFVAGDEYVAISHVWADGLGNTQENSLQKCQLSRLWRLLTALEDTVHASNLHAPRPNYYLWIDTLCCPVASLEPDLNSIAMMRMKSVYKKASQVLVLDLALSTHDSMGVHPVTLLLRIMASSIWMRRLWTLQEGVLAPSLYFQFRDQAVHPHTLILELPRNDPRFRSIIMELSGDWFRLEQLVHHNRQTSNVNFESHKLFQMIHAALNFRSVSYASDEPICIANLLGLELSRILAASEHEDEEDERVEKRMCVLWELIAEADNGIPAHVIFSVEDTLSAAGMRWAPKSLLGNKAGNAELALSPTRAALSSLQVPMGLLTDVGLSVDMPGLILESRSLQPNLPLHPWDGLPRSQEHVVFFYCAELDTWYKMGDLIPPAATRPHTATTTTDSLRPICHTIDSGQIALIKGEDSQPHKAVCWLMVQVLESCARPSSSQKPGYRVRWLRKVLVSEVHGLDRIVLHGLRGMSLEMASEPETQQFVRICQSVSLTSPELEMAKHNMLQRWMDKVAAWVAIPDFASAVERTMGSGAEQYLWASATARFSHERLAYATPIDQKWDEADGRGSFGVLKSCAVTLALCVYTAIHLNIAAAGDRKWTVYLRKAKWVLIAIFAPELVVYVAWSQRERTKTMHQCIVQNFKDLLERDKSKSRTLDDDP